MDITRVESSGGTQRRFTGQSLDQRLTDLSDVDIPAVRTQYVSGTPREAGEAREARVLRGARREVRRGHALA